MTSIDYVGIDVVGLARVEDMLAEYGAAFERRLLHPSELPAAAGRGTTERARYLATRLAAKEAWIKARTRRPEGWRFDCAAYRGESVDIDEPLELLAAEFAAELGLGPIEFGSIVGIADGVDLAGSDDGIADLDHARHRTLTGQHGAWLITAVLA